MNQSIKNLQSFLDESPFSVKAQENIIKELDKAGFIALEMNQKWQEEKGKGYYIKPNDFSGIIAWKVGENVKDLRLAAAHTDSPSLKLKLNSTTEPKNILDATIEIYGGPIYSTWLDRDLSLGGLVYFQKENSIQRKIIDFRDPIGIIPNLAIHLNREINQGFSYNAQNHLKVLYGLKDAQSKPLQKKIEEMVGFPILSSELFFYDTQKSSLTGLNKEFITSGRLDNLAMCHSILESLTDSPSSGINIGIFFDNEEIGSLTSGGAMSSFLMNTLERIYSGLNISRPEMLSILNDAFLLSADMSHAYHPSYPEKYDNDYKNELGKGPVIKSHAAFKYGTTGYSSAFFKMICQEAQVPFQDFLVRSDMISGSTIGAMTNALSGIRTVDIGNPLLAMHSIRETASVQDHLWMTQAIKRFYSR